MTAKKKGKDEFYAKVAFYLSLGFWIPLFNIAMSIISIYYAVKQMKLISKDPKRYGGFYYALVALVLAISSIIMTMFGMFIYLQRFQCGDLVIQ